MRICIEKSTCKIIEKQSGGTTQAHLDTLKSNAVNAGYDAADIDCFFEENEPPSPFHTKHNGIEWLWCDFKTWLDELVKPKRKSIMDEYEWRYNRLEREINLGLPVTLTREQIDNYMHQVHMFPDGLTEIVDPLIWPTPPEE